MNNIIELFEKEKPVREFLSKIQVNEYSYLVNELSIHHGFLLTYLTFSRSQKFVVYVASNLYRANQAYEQFCALAGFDQVNLYVVDEIVSSELVAVSGDFRFERINTVKSIFENRPKIIVTHPQALLKPLIPKTRLEKGIIDLQVGHTIEPTEAVRNLVSLGYKKMPTTSAAGEFSVRGEVIDVFSPYQDNPVRINLFDEEIESLKSFDPETQMSISKIESFRIFPISELIYDDQEKDQAIEKIQKDTKNPPRFLENDLTDIENHNNLERINKYIRYFAPEPETLLQYLSDKTVFYEDYQRLEESYQHLLLDLGTYLEHLEKPAKLDLFFFYDFHNLFYKVPQKVYLSEFKKSLNGVALDDIIPIRGYGVIDYQNDIRNLIADVKANPNKTFVFAFSKPERLGLLKEIF
ncbi:MAG: hypothetical protein WCY09_09465, partial [Candidatus Omnitrophota bacterium]